VRKFDLIVLGGIRKDARNCIKRQMDELRRFQLELQKFARLTPEGLDAQSLLFSLSPFALLQLEFDKAHPVQESATSCIYAFGGAVLPRSVCDFIYKEKQDHSFIESNNPKSSYSNV